MRSAFFLSTLLVFTGVSAHAQDRIFNYTYQSTVLNAGQREIEPWVTFRWGKKNFYRAMDTRLEYEIGLGHNLQTAFYLNATSEASGNSSGLTTDQEFSFSNEWKYKWQDPLADRIGLGLYQEFKLAPKAIELESKIILDKNFGHSIAALNLVGAMEFEKEAENGKFETEHEIELEVDVAYAFRLSKGWYVGVESTNHNEIMKGQWEHSALFAGPVISYSRDNFWINCTILPQIAAFKGRTYKGLVLDEHEKLETRMIFSYAF